LGRLFFVAWDPPWFGIQSGPILTRHLQRFKASFEVFVLTFNPPPVKDYPFLHWCFPGRRRFDLPARHWLPGSWSLRYRNWAKAAIQAFEITKADKLLICAHGDEHHVARNISLMTGAPLFCLLHDLWPAWSGPGIAATLKHAACVFPVTEALASVAIPAGVKKTSVLYPIGEEFVGNNQSSTDALKIGIAGSVDRRYLVDASGFGEAIVAIGCSPEEAEGISNVQCVPRFPLNRDAVAFLAAECQALVVSQTRHDSDYAQYAFPSRLVDFAQTGLPIILVARESTNLGRWARANNWPLWLRERDDVSGKQQISGRLKLPKEWQLCSERTRDIATTMFDASSIHNQLEKEILRQL
jgi:hypothetical protein